jgi:hypothetical protein
VPGEVGSVSEDRKFLNKRSDVLEITRGFRALGAHAATAPSFSTGAASGFVCATMRTVIGSAAVVGNAVR